LRETKKNWSRIVCSYQTLHTVDLIQILARHPLIRTESALKIAPANTRFLPLKKMARAKILSASCPRTPQTHKQKNSKHRLCPPPCPPDPYGAERPYAITLWRTPAKLTDNLAIHLLNTLIEAPCAIIITLNEIIAVPHLGGFYCHSPRRAAISSIRGE
jgi:hypothetical protein